MTDATIRPGRPDDVPKILEIQKACGLSPWTAGGYLAEIGRRDSILLVCANSDGIVIGFIVGRILIIEENQETEAEIYNIGTLPDFRKKGVGTKLITRFVGICKDRSVSRIWLEVRVSNAVAKSFYRGHGFVRHSARSEFYSNPVEDAEVMYLRL